MFHSLCDTVILRGEQSIPVITVADIQTAGHYTASIVNPIVPFKDTVSIKFITVGTLQGKQVFGTLPQSGTLPQLVIRKQVMAAVVVVRSRIEQISRPFGSFFIAIPPIETLVTFHLSLYKLPPYRHIQDFIVTIV